MQLSANRFVEVSNFRGKTYVSIREFYKDSNGETKPGKKGIALTIDQWKKLLENSDKINDMLNDRGK